MDNKRFVWMITDLGTRAGLALAPLAWLLAACSVSVPAQEDVNTSLDQQPTGSASLATGETTQVPESPMPTVGVTQPTGAGLTRTATVAPRLAPTTVFDPAGLNAGASRSFVVLDDPRMIPGTTADWLAAGETVLGVVQNGEAHAYPVSQMAYHHIANTIIGGEPYLVTY